MARGAEVPRWVQWSFAAIVVLLCFDQFLFLVAPDVHAGVVGKITYDTGIVGVSALVVLRALRHGERGPWILIAAGVVAWTLGDLFYSVFYWGSDDVPFPSPADAGYLLLPPLVLAGILWLSRGSGHERPSSLMVDGVAAALAVGALGAALVVSTVMEDGDLSLTGIVNAAYPIGDLVLLASTVGTLARLGWQLERRALWLIAGVTAFYVTDSLYLIGTVRGTYTSPSPIDVGWWLGLLALGYATWQPPPRAHDERDDERRRLVVMPLIFAALALGILLVATSGRVNGLAVTLATGSLVAVMVRLTLTFGQNVVMLRASRVEALTDPLTGLGNRRELARELGRRLRAEEPEPFELVLFDLDGFKHYNDSYGHPAGDALLQRLGHRLADHVAGRGQAFRMGGDEFCALVPPVPGAAADAAATLVDAGEGFVVGASFGSIRVPEEVADPIEAVRVADQRLYANKHAKRGSAGRQTADALLRALAAHQPDLHSHSDDVAELAEATAHRLGLGPQDVELVRQTGELHDVGKLGVPTEILDKPGRLDPDEWEFVKRHTIIGERILGGAPSLLPVAAAVRATHERWDGSGYPDGVAGTDIPLAARIVAVADAYEAMIAFRSYSAARTAAQALEELRRCAGTQFDPDVVRAFTEVCAARARAAAAAASAPVTA